MKGKGKGDGESCILSRIKPNFTIIDVAKNCTKYISVVQKKEGVGWEDLDSLQFDLEHILVNFIKRKEAVDHIISYFNSIKEMKEKKSRTKISEADGKKMPISDEKKRRISLSSEKEKSLSFSDKQEGAFASDDSDKRISISNNKDRKIYALDDKEKKITILDEKEKKVISEEKEKRMATSDEKPSKKYKESSGKAHASTSGRIKSKNLQSSKPQDYEFCENTKDIPKVQKNDSPNRFWSFIEPYCAEITLEDIKVVEDWIKLHKNDAEYQILSPLGEHFASKWFHEDLQEEMKEGTKSVECPKGFDTSGINANERENLLKKIEDNSNPDSDICPLAERLVSCLIEGNLMTPVDDLMTDACPETIVEATTSIPKPADGLNSPNLERRLHKEFEELGLLEHETEANETEDELLNELKRLQFALVPVSDHNLIQKKKLLASAKAEMVRQEMRKKVQEADAKVMEVYRAMASARSKGKKLSRKEQDYAYDILKEREKLVKDLEVMK